MRACRDRQAAAAPRARGRRGSAAGSRSARSRTSRMRPVEGRRSLVRLEAGRPLRGSPRICSRLIRTAVSAWPTTSCTSRAIRRRSSSWAAISPRIVIVRRRGIVGRGRIDLGNATCRQASARSVGAARRDGRWSVHAMSGAGRLPVRSDARSVTVARIPHPSADAGGVAIGAGQHPSGDEAGKRSGRATTVDHLTSLRPRATGAVRGRSEHCIAAGTAAHTRETAHSY